MSFRPVVRPVARAVARAVNSKTGFSPLELFAQGEQGVWFDPSDLTTLYQDAAGTIPVAADGDPVGLMLDKSPNGNHATQTVAASRPVYRTNGTLHWLAFDGVDDYMAVDTTFTNTMDMSVGIHKVDASNAVLFKDPSNKYLAAIASSGALPHTAAGSPSYAFNGSPVSPTTQLELKNTIGAGSIGVLDIDGVNISTWSSLSIGNFSGYHIHADIYSIVFSKVLSPAEAFDLRVYVASKSGVTL